MFDRSRKLVTSNDFKHRLTQPLALEDGRPPKIISSTLYAVSGFVLLGVLWAAATDFQETATATGQIVPRGQVHSVQHLEGGIVEQMFVREGEIVQAGQMLFHLDPVGTTSDRDQLESRRAALLLQLVRLEAQGRNETPDFGDIGRGFPSLALEQARLHTSTVLQRQKENATLSAKLAQRRSDLAVTQSDLETAKLQLDVQREQFAIQSRLVSQGYTARKTYLESKLMLQKAQGDVGNLEGKLRSAMDAVTEAESARAEAEANAERKTAEEKAKAASDLSETEQQLVKLSDRVSRLRVRAPADGHVLELLPKSVGEVVKPGDTVVRIVPSGRELVAEVRIESKDIGHIRAGAFANIKFTTYDSSLYGTIPGTVEYVSATAFTPQTGQLPLPGQAPAEPYYKAIVRISQDSVGTGSLKRRIAPGMLVQAQIVTGSKSVVRYMLKPVFNSLDVVLAER
jgi:membrane fusion protein, adhesin transport system